LCGIQLTLHHHLLVMVKGGTDFPRQVGIDASIIFVLLTCLGNGCVLCLLMQVVNTDIVRLTAEIIRFREAKHL
jgi:hypothetical protein